MNLPQLGSPGADAKTQEEQRRSCCSCQHRLAYSEHALFHSDGGMESDNLDDAQVYIDLGEDPVEELRQELWTRVEEAKEGGLSPTGANRLEDLLEEHLSIFD